jgi:hypothetical protein
MINIINDIGKLANYMIKTNCKNSHWINNSRGCSVPISNKYFLTFLNNSNDDIANFFDYINDNMRELSFPFEKENSIDYSFMIESEQILPIDISKCSISDISQYFDIFHKIISESNGDSIIVIDINYLTNNYILSQEKNIPNHLIEFILWKLNKFSVSEIIMLDTSGLLSDTNNMLFYQFEKCLKNFDKSRYDINKTITLYKNTNDDILTNVYWNLLYPNIKISSFLNKIKSPYDDNEFQIIEINHTLYYMCVINLQDYIDCNLLNTHNNPRIIIQPPDRLNIQV